MDSALAAAVAASLAFIISADQGGTRGPDVVAYAWAAGLGLLLFARRRYPRTVLIVTILGVVAYFAIGYPAIPLSLLVVVPLFSVAERGFVLFGATAACALVVVSVAARVAEGDDPRFVVGYELVSHLALMASAIMLGVMVRLRREAAEAQQRVLSLQERERELHAERRVREERMALAGELHDSIGHSLTLVSIHANVAEATIGADEEQAREAIANVKRAASGLLRELRATVGVLRAATSADAPASAEHLGRLLAAARSSGVAVEHAWALDGVPERLASAAYRVAQEAVSNALRHSSATRLTVQAQADDGGVRLRVVNDGVPTDPGADGTGIPAMRQRVEALGGEFGAARRGDEFVVTATWSEAP